MSFMYSTPPNSRCAARRRTRAAAPWPAAFSAPSDRACRREPRTGTDPLHTSTVASVDCQHEDATLHVERQQVKNQVKKSNRGDRKARRESKCFALRALRAPRATFTG